jgi:uncharacterized protein YkwD
MTRTTAAPPGRRSVYLALMAQILLISLIVSCASGPRRASPSALPLPSVRSFTPIMPATATPTATPVPQPSPSPTEPPATELAQPTAESTNHIIQPGDTLLGLAREYGVPMAAIQLQNDMGASTIVQVGQTVSIPPAAEWEGGSPFWMLHQVAAGETLIAIARAYNVEPAALQAVNGLDDADRIAIGQNLVLPLVAPAAPRAPTEAQAPASTSTPVPPPTAAPTEASEATEVPEAAVASADSEAPADSEASAAPNGPPADLAAWPREIARLINEVRAQHGLGPLTYNQTLEQAAQAHADDCEQRGWGSHVGSDGARIKTRVLRAGYDGDGWAECWAQTQSPARAMEIWMNETPPNDPHRRTLLSDWFSEIGIGVSDADWGTYIIADFGRP